ncbi:zinc finger homeobox protein 3-like, partial [Arapaima gigas]
MGTFSQATGINAAFCPELNTPSLRPLHLQQHESAVEGDSGYYHCALCSYSTKAKLNLIQHVRSMKHQRSESLRKLQRLQKGLPEEEEDLGAIFTIRKCPSADT